MEKINVDLNSLFNLSYNFENLKLLLTTISKNQDIFESKIRDIEDKLDNIEFNNSKKDNIFDKMPLDKKSSKDLKRDIYSDNYQDFKIKKESKIIYNDFSKKINELEDKIKLLYNFIPKFPPNTLNNILDEYQLNLDNNISDIKEVKESMQKIKNNLDEISIKMNDYDIYDIVKDIQFSGGDIEASKILIQSLDRKTAERFKFLEEKIKDDEQMALKMKNEITNLKNNFTIQKNNLTIIREQIIKMQNEIDSNKRSNLEKIKNNENEIENIKEREIKNMESINTQFQNLSLNLYDNSIKNEISPITAKENEDKKVEIKEVKEIKEKKNEENTIKSENNVSDSERDKSEEKDKMNTETSISKQKIDESNLVNMNVFNEFKDSIQKKLNNYERRIQALNSQIKNDYFQKELNSLKTEISNRKPSPQEFYDLSVQVQQYTDLYDNMKEENSNLQDELRKLRDSVSSLSKNYENLLLKTLSKNMQNGRGDNINDNDRVSILSKLGDFVEISVFNEYIREQTKFSEKIKKDFDSFKHFYDEIIDTLKKAASVQDLKSLEEYFLDLFDEFKDKCNKYYPKKSEINKNFKSIELQIKQIYEYLMKKDENSENWLLAKKPLGGFSCASCESYIGDLKENNEKILWNQLPERDFITTNTNRIGNGFSRILNLVNINKEAKDKKENNNLSNVELVNNKNEDDGNSLDKKYMNITMNKVGDEQKNIFRDYSSNNTKTNFTSKQKISFSPEDKFRLTTSYNMNLLKEMKTKQIRKGLPPISINKDDSNVKDATYNSIFEDMKDNKDKFGVPKVMKIVRKKK